MTENWKRKSSFVTGSVRMSFLFYFRGSCNQTKKWTSNICPFSESLSTSWKIVKKTRILLRIVISFLNQLHSHNQSHFLIRFKSLLDVSNATNNSLWLSFIFCNCFLWHWQWCEIPMLLSCIFATVCNDLKMILFWPWILLLGFIIFGKRNNIT